MPSNGFSIKALKATFRLMAVGQNRFGVLFWLVGELATHFRTYFSGNWDVHWGYGILTHGHMLLGRHKNRASKPLGFVHHVFADGPFILPARVPFFFLT